MEEIRPYGVVPIEIDVLQEAMEEYSAPNDRISRLEHNGSLIRLKRGLYVVSPSVSETLLSTELIANRIYGPSYVSMQSALSYHSLIPERVTVVSSATTKRARSFTNALGVYEYITVPKGYFSIGVNQVIHQNQYAFLMASPEKALCDLVISTSGLRLQSARAAFNYIAHDMRIDFDEHQWNIDTILNCAEFNRKRRELIFIANVLRNG